MVAQRYSCTRLRPFSRPCLRSLQQCISYFHELDDVKKLRSPRCASLAKRPCDKSSCKTVQYNVGFVHCELRSRYCMTARPNRAGICDTTKGV